MILADKIMGLRKRNGWSQEDLAMKLDVSRQSVSKWESAASVPDLDKIIKLAQLFGVSTDYLLKDELEEDTLSPAEDKYEKENLIAVSLEAANAYMDAKRSASKKIAFGVMLCVLSPVLLIFMGGLSESRKGAITENMAGGIGVVILLAMVCIAVLIFILNDMKLKPFEQIEKENFSPQFGVEGLAKKRQEEFSTVFRMGIIIGVALCILSPVPILVSAAFAATDFVVICCVCLLLIMVACAVFLFVWVGIVNESFNALLQQEDYSPNKKELEKQGNEFAGIYWSIVLAGYLLWSFLSRRWDITWVVWPVAGILFGVVSAVVAIFRNRKNY